MSWRQIYLQDSPSECPVSIFNYLMLTVPSLLRVYHSAAHAFSAKSAFSLKYFTLVLFQIAPCTVCIEHSAVTRWFSVPPPPTLFLGPECWFLIFALSTLRTELLFACPCILDTWCTLINRAASMGQLVGDSSKSHRCGSYPDACAQVFSPKSSVKGEVWVPQRAQHGGLT